ncbi:TonB-dependent siderophore receptor [Roseibium sp. RKSG952]|uniref:TonB-dependent receptor plug domain-containing protein n=1 Tax=Roseibium sp. RKSG952 TaxID=2529384 RepID=UPI0018AD10C1|nr:TonB-dependent receptor [Roseibium sp. RKSG952]
MKTSNMRRVTPALLVAGFPLCLAGTVPASAQDQVDEDTAVVLEQIVVSAGRNPVEAQQVGRAYTILTSDDLEETQTRYVADALRRVPGVSVSRTGNNGGLTQVRLRGSEANHVLVLIDGVEVAGTSDGGYDFGALQTADIERIEVLRGPQSALYGSNAMSGVIHIITKGGVRNGYRVSAQSEMGTDESILGNVLVQGGSDRFDVAVSAAASHTRGFNISHYGSEKDGGHNVTLNGKSRVDILDNLFLDTSLRYTERRADTDDQDWGVVIDTRSHTQTNDFFGGADLTWVLMDGLFTQKLKSTGSDLNSRSEGQGYRSGYDGNRYHASYQGTLAFELPDLLQSAHSLTGALEWERETFKNAYQTVYTTKIGHKRDLLGNIVEYRGEFSDRAFVTGALRYDQNDAFKDTVTYSTSGAYLFPQTDTKLHASMGTGSTNPSFFEQFGSVPESFVGNPDLKPENSFAWDIGVEQKLWQNRAVLDVTYFNERLRDEITVVSDANWISTPENLDGTSKRQGVEVSIGLQLLQNLHATATYTYLDATEPDGSEEIRRPPHSGSLTLTYGFHDNRGTLFMDAVYNGRMRDEDFATWPATSVTLDDYILVNAGADYQLSDQLTLFGRVENLLDQDYEEVYGYNTQGFTAFAGFRATF